MSIWKKYEYKLVDFGGVDNCAKCDKYDHVWEFDREDGLVVALCESCRDEVVRIEPEKVVCSYGHKYLKSEASNLGCPECVGSFLEKGGSLD